MNLDPTGELDGKPSKIENDLQDPLLCRGADDEIGTETIDAFVGGPLFGRGKESAASSGNKSSRYRFTGSIERSALTGKDFLILRSPGRRQAKTGLG
jgi:hypothetical protein